MDKPKILIMGLDCIFQVLAWHLEHEHYIYGVKEKEQIFAHGITDKYL